MRYTVLSIVFRVRNTTFIYVSLKGFAVFYFFASACERGAFSSLVLCISSFVMFVLAGVPLA